MVLLRNCGFVFLVVWGLAVSAEFTKVLGGAGDDKIPLGGPEVTTPVAVTSTPESTVSSNAAPAAATDKNTIQQGNSCQQVQTANLKTYQQVPLETAVESCKSAQSSAAAVCLESLNPNIQGAIAVIGGLLSGIQAMSMSDVCSQQNKAMDVAKNAMTAYNLACGAMMMKCESACQKVQKENGICATTNPPTLPPGSPNPEFKKCEEAVKEAKAGVNSSCVVACSSYKLSLAAGAAGLMQLIARLGKAKECKDKTQTTATASATPIDCTIAANKTLIKCICDEKPLSPGCPGQQIGQARGGINTTTTVPATTTSLTDPNLQLNKDLDGPMALGSQSGGTNSGNGAGGAAGGAGSGGGSAAAKNSDGSKGAQKTSLNPNILSGDFGGGGGGGSRGGGSDRENSPYKPYLPGGVKDPARGTASSAVEVTGAGGIDNWTKVNRVYQEARPTLMGK